MPSIDAVDAHVVKYTAGFSLRTDIKRYMRIGSQIIEKLINFCRECYREYNINSLRRCAAGVQPCFDQLLPIKMRFNKYIQFEARPPNVFYSIAQIETLLMLHWCEATSVAAVTTKMNKNKSGAISVGAYDSILRFSCAATHPFIQTLWFRPPLGEILLAKAIENDQQTAHDIQSNVQ